MGTLGSVVCFSSFWFKMQTTPAPGRERANPADHDEEVDMNVQRDFLLLVTLAAAARDARLGASGGAGRWAGRSACARRHIHPGFLRRMEPSVPSLASSHCHRVPAR